MYFRRTECCSFVHNTTPYIHPRSDSRNWPRSSECLNPVKIWMPRKYGVQVHIRISKVPKKEWLWRRKMTRLTPNLNDCPQISVLSRQISVTLHFNFLHMGAAIFLDCLAIQFSPHRSHFRRGLCSELLCKHLSTQIIVQYKPVR